MLLKLNWKLSFFKKKGLSHYNDLAMPLVAGIKINHVLSLLNFVVPVSDRMLNLLHQD